MKKTTIPFLLSGLLIITGVKAQTMQEGIDHLHADRFKSAIAVFEKLLAVNPNNMEATYWLGQTYFDDDKNATARQLYEKALSTNGNAPLILVGLGHADLLDHKPADARQRFEAAILASRTKKGDDPSVLHAIGRANVDAKDGDLAYAIEKLEAAVLKDSKNPDAVVKDTRNTEIYLQLGNAYRKARPGEGGGLAYTNYKKALEVNPAFAVVNVRLSKLFETQKNWELVLQYLNEAIARDAKFAPAYYELFYYYFYRQQYPEAEAQLQKYITCTDDQVANDYLYAQMCWGKKDFDCAITKASNVITALGSSTKPKVYKLLAYAYADKKDYANARKYVDMYFAREKPEGIIALDFKLKADIISQTGGSPDEIYNTYIQGAEIDTVLTSKIDFLKKGTAYFKANKMRDMEAQMIQKIIELKPKPTINDYFDLTLAYYFSGNHSKSRDGAVIMTEKFPDQVYGYEWVFNNSNVLDTVKKDSIAVPDAIKLYEFSQKDTSKFKKQYISSVKFLGAYYINEAKDKEKSLEYFTKWLEADTANSSIIQPIIDQIKKMPARQPAAPKSNTTPKTSNPQTGNTKTASTTASTKATAKK